ncbi:peptidyl-prolyl cis-trans isomeras-like protein-like 2 [Calycina marina]|uniref:Peptidyl-prolyl cis-trans isomerase-like 2 n=1 Tax=Calycina marina TaxID=1763456 RepID=A0A9P7Z0P9_9HELO|nr:peptidyl-prolyl cis-trans isomeras-like protein-like 2 [Calycina marina]
MGKSTVSNAAHINGYIADLKILDTDKLYITHSEWSSSDAYSASAGSNVRLGPADGSFKRLPFNFCAASLQPFKHPVCTSEGTIFDVEVISDWLAKHGTNPINGEPLEDKDLIKLNFARNGDTEVKDTEGRDGDGQGEMMDPVTFKVFTDNTHIVAVRHGSEANVFAWETVERLNIKGKMWRDLVDDREFGRSDIITLQDPQNIESRDMSQFKFLKDGESVLSKAQEEERSTGSVNVAALGRVGEKVLKAKEAVEKARRERFDPNRLKAISKTVAPKIVPQSAMIQEKSSAYNAAQYTTGRAAASFTSTGLTPETSGERALLSDEEYMLRPKIVKNKGYARIETNIGDLNIELQTETAPRAVWNFVLLAKKGYYNGFAFHRNIKNFMIQGGDPTGTGKGGTSIWGKNFNDEFDGPLLHDARGVMSMANKGKNTNSSQFFITYKAAKHLDKKHTIFGRVVGGMDVLDKIERVPVGANDRPVDDIVMEHVVVFVDPFEEFQKERADKDAAEKLKQDIIKQGGTEDDNTTWTGKRLRRDGTVIQSEGSAGVGKYLKTAASSNGNSAQNAEEYVEGPVKKKIKSKGFENFDGW